MNIPYSGADADLFAVGVLLFIMVAGNQPFGRAIPTDVLYGYIYSQNYFRFWTKQQQNRRGEGFSTEFISLISNMLAFDPTQRLSLSEIKNSDFYRGPLPTHEELVREFEIKLERIQEHERIIQQKKQSLMSNYHQETWGRKPVFRGVTMKGDSKEEMISPVELECTKSMRPEFVKKEISKEYEYKEQMEGKEITTKRVTKKKKMRLYQVHTQFQYKFYFHIFIFIVILIIRIAI